MLERYKIFFLNHLSNYLNSLADALCQMGHQMYYQSSWNMKEIEAGIRFFRPEFLVTVGYDKPMAEASVDRIRELCKQYKLYHIYWATEDKIHFETISLSWVRRMRPDMVWTIHPDCVHMYRKLGIASEYMNFAFNPRVFPPKPDLSEEKFDISFVGTTHLETRTYRYDSLRQLLFPLIQSGIRTDVWGHNWSTSKHFLEQKFGLSVPSQWHHGYLPYKHTAHVYHQSKIMLGVQNARDQVTQRTFEIMGAGAFMIASRTEELLRLFKDKEEIVLSSHPEETLELVDYYLQHPEERRSIGKNARTKVMSEHTFSHRLKQVWPATLEHFKTSGGSRHD